jgi:hypothetical protein
MKHNYRHVLLLALIFCNLAFAADDAGTDKTPGNWRLKCASGTCQLSAVNKAGDEVFLELEGPKGGLRDFGFLVKADIDAQRPLGFEFAHLVADKGKKGCAQATDMAHFPHCFDFKARDEDSFSGPITACKGGICISKLMGDADTEQTVIPRFQGFEYVLLVFRDSKGELQDRVLDISGFKAAYDDAVGRLAQAH